MAIGSRKTRREQGYHFNKPTRQESEAVRSVIRRQDSDYLRTRLGMDRKTADSISRAYNDNWNNDNQRTYFQYRSRAERNEGLATPIQRRIEKATGVGSRWTESDRIARMRSAVDAFMSHQPRGGVITNSTHG